MAKRPTLQDENARRISAAYYRAKTADPSMTQGEFATKTFPTISARYTKARNRSEQRRIEESGARYLRLVLEGERTGRVNVERGTIVRGGGSPDLFQVFVPYRTGAGGEEFASFDLEAVGARSTFDIPLVEQQLRRHPELLGTKAAQWARRYDVSQADLQTTRFSVRRVTRHRKHSVMVDLTK